MERTIVCERMNGVKERRLWKIVTFTRDNSISGCRVNITAVGGHADHKTLWISIDRCFGPPETKFRVLLPCHVCLAAGGLLSARALIFPKAVHSYCNRLRIVLYDSENTDSQGSKRPFWPTSKYENRTSANSRGIIIEYTVKRVTSVGKTFEFAVYDTY